MKPGTRDGFVRWRLPCVRSVAMRASPLTLLAVFVIFAVANIAILESYGPPSRARVAIALPPSHPAAEQRYVHNRTHWPDEDLDAMLRRTIPRKHWRLENLRRTKDAAHALKVATGCDVLTVPFAAADDHRCVQHLTDTTNWQDLVPLAMRFDARTIKFQVKFNNQDLHSILKVPQRLFPNEAFSEEVSYLADRVLNVRRIPPTGWVCIPIAVIQRSVAKYGAGVETEAEFLKDSGVKSYNEWIQKDLLDYAEKQQLIEKNDSGEDCIGASIQLHVADVHHLLDSPLRIPYKAHDKSWHKYFDLTDAPADDPLKKFAKERWAASIVHISELNVFDYVIGNGDRSPNKNNFVVGMCQSRHAGVCDEDTEQFKTTSWLHPGHPTYVHLDQGMGFYDKPRNNPIAGSKENHTFCVFRAPQIRVLHKFASAEAATELFSQKMWPHIPRAPRRFVSQHTLRGCDRRIREVMAIVDACLEQPFGHYVLAP